MDAEEKSQLRVLYRDFLSRMVDLEILSTRGEVRELVARCGGLLAAMNLTLMILIVPKYGLATGPMERLMPGFWNDEEFFISATIAVAGLFAVFVWNAVFPDKRECLILGVLPVRRRIIALAKLAVMGTGLGAAIAVGNVFTGFTLPFLAGGLRSFAAWWLVLIAAGGFAFCSALAIQGIASQVLGWRPFLRVSGLLQLLALFAVLALFFLTPPFTLTVENGSRWIALLPSFWFTGLLEVLKGRPEAMFRPLAWLAIRNLTLATVVAGVGFALSYYRNLRRIVESPDISAAGLRAITVIANFFAKIFLPRPLDRAIVMFTGRTVARSQQHRLLLAIYGGAGCALALAFVKSLFEGSGERWYQPNVPLLVAGAIVVLSAIGGMKAVFAFPQALRANWIFRITAVHSPAAYFGAVRKSLIALAAIPAWMATGAAYSSMWPARIALAQTAILIVAGFLLVDRSLYQFRKIPFTCSWLPEGPQAKMRALVYGLLFILVASIIGNIELWSFDRLSRFLVLLAIMAAVAIGAARRRSQFAAAPENALQFEQLPPADIFALDLRADGAWLGDEAYVDTIDPTFGHSFVTRRIKPIAAGIVALLIAGFVYEQLAEWRDRRGSPEIGRRYDIGGRSLNIYCSGAGSPAAIFESAAATPGMEWDQIEKAVSRFTRVCWYDRAGLGWSDPAPHLNLSDAIAKDLHALLGKAGVKPPYVLVGHAQGGFHVRMYRSLYPDEVAGMVLVDSSHEDTALPQTAPGSMASPFMVHLVGAAGRVGLVRILAPDKPEFRWQTLAAGINEGPEWADAAEARQTGSLGDIPLIVLTAGRYPPEIKAKWIASQGELVRLSTRGHQFLFSDCGHDMPAERPDVVVEAVRAVFHM